MKHTVDAMGKQCPIPVVMTKKILDKAEQGDEIQVLVDNETAVNNLSRLAGSTGCSFVSRKTDGGYEIRIEIRCTGQNCRRTGNCLHTCCTTGRLYRGHYFR